MNLIQSIQSTLYERVVSPLAGVFLMSWAVMHYDLIMMLMSKNDMVFKIDLINQHLVLDAKNNWSGFEYVDYAPYYFGLIKPLLYSLLVLVIYPIFSVPAYLFSMTGRYALQRIRRIFDEKTPVAAEKFIEVQESLRQQANEHRETTRNYEIEIEAYKKINQASKAESVQAAEENKELKVELAELISEAVELKNSSKEQGAKLELQQVELETALTQLKSDNNNLADKYEKVQQRLKESGLDDVDLNSNDSSLKKSGLKNLLAGMGVYEPEDGGLSAPAGLADAVRTAGTVDLTRIARMADIVSTAGAVDLTRTAGLADIVRTAGAVDLTRTAGLADIVSTAGAVDLTRTAGLADIVRTAGAVDLTKTAGLTDVYLKQPD
jgi:hypothetical protein